MSIAIAVTVVSDYLAFQLLSGFTFECVLLFLVLLAVL